MTSSGDLRRALAELDAELARVPNDSSATAARGRVRRRLGDLVGAEKDLAAAAEASPKEALLHVELGEVRGYNPNHKVSHLVLEGCITLAHGMDVQELGLPSRTMHTGRCISLNFAQKIFIAFD